MSAMPSMATVRGIVAGDLALYGLTSKAIEKLRRALSFANPEVVQLKRLGRYWNTPSEGLLPERIEVMTEWPDGSVRVPRGAVAEVRALLANYDCRLEAVEDRRTRGSGLGSRASSPPWRSIDQWDASAIDLRYYQEEALAALVRRTQGIVVIACGGGKTRLGVATIAHLNRTTLVIAHTGDLLDQWEAEIAKARGIAPGILDGDRGRAEIDREIVVASVFSLAKLLEEDPTWAERFGLVILDEAHHAPAVTFQKVMSRVPAYYRLFLTATPDREDGLTPIMFWMGGEKIYEKDALELMAEGYLMRPDIEIVESAFTFDYSGPAKKAGHALAKAIEHDEGRNTLIVDIANLDAAQAETVLILSNRKAHCRLLGKMLAARGVPHRVILGTTKKSTRKASIDELRGGEVPVVIATSLADEGLDVRRLSRVILAWPERAKSRTQQRVGRLMREWPAKEPKLYDVVDSGVPTLARRASERAKVYRELGLLRRGR